jgi:ABC-type nitrate/sulfonate/bicarbonate transport system substrate-binding protein/nitrogen-specific signal transduction histidine kinase
MSAQCIALEKVSLQLKWQHQFQFAGYYAAKIKGFYGDAGLDVDIIEGDSHVNIIERVTEGSAEYGTGNSDILLAHYEGAPVVILAVIMQHSPYVLVTRSDKSFQSIHDMIGKRLMIEPHAAELIAYLSREGIAPDSYHSSPYTDLQRFIDEEVDAVSVYLTDEPYLLQQQGIEFNTYYPASAGIDFYGDNLFTTRQEIDEHPDRVRRFREASLRGWEYALNNPEEIIEYIVETYPERHSREQLIYEARKMRQLMYSDLIAVGYMLPGRWQHIAEIYKGLSLLPHSYDMDGLLYSPQSFMYSSQEFVRALAGWAITAFILLLIGILTFKLYLLNKKLHSALEYKNQLANIGESISNVSHQWKQPLNELGIQFMRIQQLMARESSKESQEIEGLVGKGNELLQFMADTVDAFGEVMGNRNQIVTFSPRSAIKDLLRLQSDGYQQNGITIHIQLDQDAELQGNVASFIQGIMNVVGNAKDVLIDRAIENPGIWLISSVEQGAYQIEIQDNGGGVEPLHLKRIFDLGYSAKTGVSSGLGLYIARKIIREQFHGTLTARATPKGICFKMRFPLPNNALDLDR